MFRSHRSYSRCRLSACPIGFSSSEFQSPSELRPAWRFRRSTGRRVQPICEFRSSTRSQRFSSRSIRTGASLSFPSDPPFTFQYVLLNEWITPPIGLTRWIPPNQLARLRAPERLWFLLQRADFAEEKSPLRSQMFGAFAQNPHPKAKPHHLCSVRLSTS